jgi:hypothetical protein
MPLPGRIHGPTPTVPWRTDPPLFPAPKPAEPEAEPSDPA